MKKQLFLLIGIGLSISVFAQKNWQNDVLIRIAHATIENTYTDYPITSIGVEFNKHYNGHCENWLSFSKQVGIGLRYSDLSWESGGLGGHAYNSGAYFYSTVNLAFLAQIRVGKSYIVQLGPRGEINLIGYESSKYDWWQLVDYGDGFHQVSGGRKTSDFNRNYFKQPYYGMNFRLMNKPEDARHSVGLEFNYLWTRPTRSNFNTKHLIQLGFVVQL
ncbi:MAG TPA: hypothetical protein VKA27_02705 [Sunxiuqinia sp.]|nr:hypothetical protein [Sunxiuqinia sp.]